MIPQSEWKWFGKPGHFICAIDCRFHLCTQVGRHLVSTVGEYLPDSEVCDILARSRGIVLEGRGDYRRDDWIKKNGYEKIGCDRLYETMVFAISGKVCNAEDCNCGQPEIVPSDLDCWGYMTAGDAMRGHYQLCEKWADEEPKP